MMQTHTRTLYVVIVFAAVVSFGMVSQLFAQVKVDTDPKDRVLIAYKLTPKQELDFEQNKDTLCDFWEIWTSRSLDFLDMNPLTHETWQPPDQYEGFIAGEDDAQLHVLAAWGEKGLYLKMQVTDDDFSDVIITDSKGRTNFQGTDGDRTAEGNNDACEIRLCHNSSEELAADFASFFPLASTGLPKNGNPYSMAQYGLRFGGDLPDPDIEIFRRNPSYDPTVTDTTHEQSGEYVWERYNLEQEAPDKGFDVKVVNSGANVRVQVWRIAWNQVGKEGAFVKPDQGKMIAALFAYLDVDQGMEYPKSDIIYSYRLRSTMGWPTGLNAWGDLYFGDLLDVADPIPVLPKRAILPAHRAREGIGRYSLTGRTVKANRSTGMVLERLSGDAGRRIVQF